MGAGQQYLLEVQMKGFLSTKKIASTIEDIIMNAKERIVIVSPYIKVSQQDLSRLKSADNAGVHIQIVYREDELKPEVRKMLFEIDNLELYSLKNLHAKCYFNERRMIITSLNYYWTSEKLNWEMGVLIDRDIFGDVYQTAVREVELMIKESKVVKTTKQEQEEEPISEVEIALKKEYEFERYIYEIFASQKEDFVIEDWNPDYHRVESSKKPDFIVTCKRTKRKFAVECKYQSGFSSSDRIKDPVLKWSTREQIKGYNDFSSKENMPVSIVIGLGGEPDTPECVYCIPLSKTQNREIYPSVYMEHKRSKPDKKFFLKDNGVLE